MEGIMSWQSELENHWPDCGMVTVTVLLCLVVMFIIYWLRSETQVVANIYRLPGRYYWLKRIAFSVLMRLRSARKRKMKPMPGTDNLGYGRGLTYEQMERPQLLMNIEYAIDCCYFGATNKEGVNFVCRIARRNNRTAEIWLFMEIPNLGCLQFSRHPDTDVYYTDGKTFQAGGLSFEIIEPMSKWKITYSGKLRKGLCNDISNKPTHFLETNFSFVWNAFSQPFNSDTDMSSSALGDSVAREKWNKDFFQRLKNNHQSHYEQWGELRGRLNIEGQEEMQITLQCIRDHSFGNRDWRYLHRYIIHYIYLETGMSIQVGIVSQPNLMSHVKIGYVSYANGDITPVTDVKLNIWEVGEDTKDPPKKWSFSFDADGQTYFVNAIRGTTPIWYHHSDRGGKVMEVFTTFKVNSFQGRGISEYFYRYIKSYLLFLYFILLKVLKISFLICFFFIFQRNLDGPNLDNFPPFYKLVEEPSFDIVSNNQSLLSLPFAAEACKSSALVGGKGAQLAQLKSIETKITGKVPPGFCLTLKSFEVHVQMNAAIAQNIQKICSASVNDIGKLTSVCVQTVELINAVDICSQVKEAIITSLKDYVDVNYEEIHFAIRSSAAGEDGNEASSAGQMETILGVVGLTQILNAVKKCWSSAYTAQAVEYRRQHGQPINVPVGVVIQKMVPAESAGVLFTADPITQSNSHLVINANFGLGESVVSGKINPDTVYVERDPDYLHDSEKLKIGCVKVGNKTVKITETGLGGVVEESLGVNGSKLCIQDTSILDLAKLGMELEKYFGSPRDIEWAIVNNDIFLLQCRPITVTDTETEDDLMHEFDSPITCDYQWWTTCNISEMMPGAVTPLTLSLFKKLVNNCTQHLTMLMGSRQSVASLPKTVLSNCNHLFLSVLDLSAAVMTAMYVRNEVLTVSLLGQLLPELQNEQIQKYYGRNPRGMFRKLLNFVRLIKASMKSMSVMKEWEQKLKTFEIGTTAKTSEELYQCIDQNLKTWEKAWLGSVLVSSRSGNMTTALISVIGGDPNKWTFEHYGDIALLLSNCIDVYSAEVPHAMESIAKEIAEKGEEFVKLFLDTNDEDCMQLIETYPELKKSVNIFLSRHGHRCLRESELREKSWQSAPEKFISVLKIVLKNKSYEKSQKSEVSVSELLDKMKTKISFHKKLIIKLLLPKAWKVVGEREWAKSLAIKMNDIFKLAYFRLANLLLQEGRLPDPDLVYFLTHQEISKLLNTPSAHLIIKAQKRRKVLNKQMAKKFEKICKSQPKLIDVTNFPAENVIGVEVLKGMPVSQGQVKGPAKVVHSLEEASVIKPGDILVVSSTDVGWSPYFPLIAGLVTELGGLISHGAVVAREYGIPCVVNVSLATSSIRTGEMLEIDGRLGTIKRLDIKTVKSNQETESS